MKKYCGGTVSKNNVVSLSMCFVLLLFIFCLFDRFLSLFFYDKRLQILGDLNARKPT